MAVRSHVEKEGGWKKAKFLLLASLEEGSQKGKKEGVISPFFAFLANREMACCFVRQQTTLFHILYGHLRSSDSIPCTHKLAALRYIWKFWFVNYVADSTYSM